MSGDAVAAAGPGHDGASSDNGDDGSSQQPSAIIVMHNASELAGLQYDMERVPCLSRSSIHQYQCGQVSGPFHRVAFRSSARAVSAARQKFIPAVCILM